MSDIDTGEGGSAGVEGGEPDRLASANQHGREMTTGNSGTPSEVDPHTFHGTDVHTAGARAADRLPRTTEWPAAASRRVSPRHWGPVPPRMPMVMGPIVVVAPPRTRCQRSPVSLKP